MFPVAASQSLRVLSSLPDSTRAPSGENATEVTRWACPSKVRSSHPVAASQSLRVLSSLPDSTRAPSGEKATEVTRLECGIRGTISVLYLPSAGEPTVAAVFIATSGVENGSRSGCAVGGCTGDAAPSCPGRAAGFFRPHRRLVPRSALSAVIDVSGGPSAPRPLFPQGSAMVASDLARAPRRR